ncbi:MAG: nucleotidyltransferase family protein [Dehalococcoidia bacterium]|nr:nucleotidyltransferase family protein [Dehalococcoidia bacterium]
MRARKSHPQRPSPHMAAVAALLLAAGESRRMGAAKALLRWKGTFLLQYQIRQLLQAGVSEIIVVLGHDADRLLPEVQNGPEVTVVVNPDYRQGRTTSIKAGLRRLSPACAGIMVLAVDQPRRADILRRLVEEFEQRPSAIVAPEYQGRGGHPAIFARSLLDEMRAITEAKQGLREVTQRHRAELRLVPFETPEVLLDINTPQEYQDAMEQYGGPEARPPNQP